MCVLATQVQARNQQPAAEDGQSRILLGVAHALESISSANCIARRLRLRICPVVAYFDKSAARHLRTFPTAWAGTVLYIAVLKLLSTPHEPHG